MQSINQTNREGENREDGEDHNFYFIAIRHTQHVRLKGPEPRWSDIIMTMKEKQNSETASKHVPRTLQTLETLRGFHTPLCAGTGDWACVQTKLRSLSQTWQRLHSMRTLRLSRPPPCIQRSFTKLFNRRFSNNSDWSCFLHVQLKRGSQ